MGYIFDALNRKRRSSDAHAEAQQRLAAAGTALEPQPAAPPPDVEAALARAQAATDQLAAFAAEPAEDPARPAPVTPPAPIDAADLDDRLVTITQPASVMAEEYRAIRTGILARWQQKRHLVHTITSATPQEGKTLTSLNLGLSFAELRNRRTIVVEADLRLPQFANLLRLPEESRQSGLVEHLEGMVALERAVQRLGALDVLPAGRPINDRAVQLLSGAPAAKLIETLRQRYDHVIVDTPPVVELADAGILGALSDEVLLVARLRRTPRPLIEQAVRILASYNAPVAGVIGTDDKRDRRRGYYYYRYGYGYASKHGYRASA